MDGSKAQITVLTAENTVVESVHAVVICSGSTADPSEQFMAIIQPAKITRPDIGSSLKRDRALSLLSSACSRPLVWIAAPAGSGKTTLVSSYLEYTGLPCLWYQMDESDSDPATFFYYARLAAKGIDPAAAESLPLLTPEYTYGLNTFACRYMENLAMILHGAVQSRKTDCSNTASSSSPRSGPDSSGKGVFADSFQSTMPGSSCLVLDDYQEVSEASGLHGLLASSLQRLPGDVNVIIISRHHPPAQYSRLRGSGHICLLGWEEVRFSLEETRKLFWSLSVQAGGTDQEECDKRTGVVHRITDGWAAGVVLLAERQRWAGSDVLHSEKGHLPEEIIDYFAHEVCGSIDTDILEFLMTTAFLPQMTPYTAQAVSGNRHAGRILSELYHRSRFTERRATKPLVYQYHPLFKQFLRSRAQSSFSREKLQGLQKRAAELMARTGQTEEAVELLLSCGSHDAAAGLILRKARSMTARGRGKTLESWIRRLPASMYETKPWLRYWLGFCRWPFNPSEARELFHSAFEAFISAGDEQGALTAWCGAVESILLERDDFRQLDFWVDWLDGRLEQGQSFASREIELRVTAGMVGIVLFRNPGHAMVNRWIARAQELINEPLSLESAACLCDLIMYHLKWGRVVQAGSLIRRMEPYIAASSPPVLRIKWCLVRAMHAHMSRGDGAEVVQLAEEGLAIGRETGVHVFDLFLLAQGVHGGLTRYDLKLAREYLDAMAANLKDSRLWDASNYHFLHGWLDYCAGDIPGFREHMQVALNLVDKIGCTLSLAGGHAGVALACLESSDMDNFRWHMDKAREIVPEESDIPGYLYLLIQSLGCFRARREQEGVRLLSRALSIGRSNKLLTIPFWKKETMSLVCAKALEHGIETEYVSELISRRNLCPLSGRAREICLLEWPFPLKIFALGGFYVQLNGRPLQGGKKSRNKPLEMLKALVAHGAREVPSQKIMDVLYPEIDGDRANYSYKFTLHQLRSILAPGKYLVSRGGRLSIDEASVFVDVLAFQDLCRLIRQEQEYLRLRPDFGCKERDEYMVHLCQKAVKLYRGEFLQGEGTESAVISREKLRSSFLELVDIYGSRLERQGRYLEALRLYERSIETDSLQEMFYRRLMRCYARDGQSAAVHSVFQRCSNALDACLGIKPSEDTRKVYRTLMGS